MESQSLNQNVSGSQESLYFGRASKRTYRRRHSGSRIGTSTKNDLGSLPVQPLDGANDSKHLAGGMLPRGKRFYPEPLTEAEKKANHIASEQKRRQNIRVGFEQLLSVVPMEQGNKSEAYILHKAGDYLRSLLQERQFLEHKLNSLCAELGVSAPLDLDLQYHHSV